MKIMFINSVIDYGSTGKIVRDLANGMIADGHTVRIIFGRHSTSNAENCVDISNNFSTLSHVLMTRVFGRHGLHSNRATKKVIAEIETFDPDVIHLHNLHGYYLNYKILMEYLKTRDDIKIVWTLHDLWPITGSSAYYSYDGCEEWDEGCVICSNPKQYPESWLFHRQRKNFYDKKEAFSNLPNLEIVTVSKWLKAELDKSYLSQYDITPIYNGLDFEPFKDIHKEESDFVELLGVANIWETRKGLSDFIEFSKIIPAHYRITLIGLSDKQIESLPNNIKGITRTSNFKELIQYYANADLYLNLSVEETMGMTTVESLAAGTPVVVYDKTAVPEIIDETVGTVVDAGNLNKLLEAVDYELKRNVSKETCREFAKQHYSKQQMLENYKNIYKKEV